MDLDILEQYCDEMALWRVKLDRIVIEELRDLKTGKRISTQNVKRD